MGTLADKRRLRGSILKVPEGQMDEQVEWFADMERAQEVESLEVKRWNSY